MKAVGIKALKAKLGEYVRMVKAGETILITDREEVVAELRPAQRQPGASESLEARLTALADRHEATLRSAEGPWGGPKARARLSGLSSQQILDALRGE